MKNKIKLIACQALAHLLEPMAEPGVERVILPISLHLNPDALRDRLMGEVAQIEQTGCDIILGYGLCGRALEGVCSKKSRLVLPKVDDCIGAVLGSRRRHRSILAEDAGCFFLEPSWVGTDVDIFAQSLKGLDRIPEAYRDKIVSMALKHYSKLALLCHGQGGEAPAVSVCRGLAEKYHLEFVRYFSDLRLLQKLAGGRWNDSEFIVTEPEQCIPYF